MVTAHRDISLMVSSRYQHWDILSNTYKGNKHHQQNSVCNYQHWDNIILDRINTCAGWLCIVSMIYFSCPHSRWRLAPMTSDIFFDTLCCTVASSPISIYPNIENMNYCIIKKFLARTSSQTGLYLTSQAQPRKYTWMRCHIFCKLTDFPLDPSRPKLS